MSLPLLSPEGSLSLVSLISSFQLPIQVPLDGVKNTLIHTDNDWFSLWRLIFAVTMKEA